MAGVTAPGYSSGSIPTAGKSKSKSKSKIKSKSKSRTSGLNTET
jgi:hypothetical protein